ncbi:prepilin-type N-terminal cleavage/methylation domain-containing protein [Candidatus Berkelbacteria bacterium]|nr:prepilin-type N-terminal cleavage/methylation domain-containing protein [Candidatus Berkelbacteria bacterium]
MRRGGFTIIEVLTVIMVFSILIGISGYAYSVALKRTRDQQRISDLNNIKSAIELYYLDIKSFPAFYSGSNQITLAEYQLAPGTFNCVNNYRGIWPSFIQNFPRDPLSKLNQSGNDCTSLATASAHKGEYLYFVKNAPSLSPKSEYMLMALVERINNVNTNVTQESSTLSSWGYALDDISLCDQVNDSLCSHNYKLLSGKNN